MFIFRGSVTRYGDLSPFWRFFLAQSLNIIYIRQNFKSFNVDIIVFLKVFDVGILGCKNALM